MYNFTSRYPSIITLVLFAISILSSFYFYRKTSLGKFKKYLLISIKTLAIFLILFLFIEPALLAIIKSHKEPINIVLVDNSRSNYLPDTNNKLKSEQVKEFLSNSTFKKDEYILYTFSNSNTHPQKTPNTDSIKFDGFETDIYSALEKLRDILPGENFNSIIIISDGVFNSGKNPIYQAKTFQCPFFTIGIGDTIQQKDISIDKVYFNEKAFTERTNIIKADIKAFKLNDETVTINLVREGTVIETKKLDIKNDNVRTDITFEIKESNPGIFRYRIESDKKAGEITFKNNYYDFLIEYLDNKVKVLYISDGPGYDNAVISGILKRIKNYEITFKTARTNNDFYEGAINYKSFGELTALFLLGFPTLQTNREIVTQLAENIKKYNIPVIFFAGRNTDYKKLESLDELIPFTITKPAVVELMFNLQIVSNPEYKLDKIKNELISAPKIFRNQISVLQKAGSEVLMTDKNTGDPILITRGTLQNKSTAFMGYGLWKWGLNSNNNKPLLERFILEIINLTLLKEEKTKFRIYPDKDIFDYTESVRLTAEVYDENYLPITNAIINAKIYSIDNRISEKITLNKSEDKYYSIDIKLPINDYKIEAEAEVNGNLYAKDVSRFIVDSLNLEFRSTKSNFEILSEISNNTEGSFYNSNIDIKEIDEKLSIIKKDADTSLTKSFKLNLWENKYLLFTIIILFSIEWVVRKRNNIP